MKAITRIYVVYAAVPFIVLEQDGVISSTGTSQDEIDFNELGNYVRLFKQQQDALGNGYNWSRGFFTQNNKQFEAAIFDSIPGGSTPPPGAVTKNFVIFNGSNLGTVDIVGITFPAVNDVSGTGYNDIFPVTNGQSKRGDLNATPASGNVEIEIDVAGLSSTSDLRLYAFGENATVEAAPVDNGAGQTFTVPYSVVYGGTLFVVLVVGAQATLPPAPPARSGAFRIGTNKPYYQVNSIDAADITATGFTFPVVGSIQNGGWAMNTATNLTFNATASVPPSGNCWATLYVNNVAVDTIVINSGTANYTFVNVPLAIPDGQPLRLDVYGD